MTHNSFITTAVLTILFCMGLGSCSTPEEAPPAPSAQEQGAALVQEICDATEDCCLGLGKKPSVFDCSFNKAAANNYFDPSKAAMCKASLEEAKKNRNACVHRVLQCGFTFGVKTYSLGEVCKDSQGQSFCDQGLYCDEVGKCAARFPDGAACTKDEQCLHTCSQGVCAQGTGDSCTGF